MSRRLLAFSGSCLSTIVSEAWMPATVTFPLRAFHAHQLQGFVPRPPIPPLVLSSFPSVPSRYWQTSDTAHNATPPSLSSRSIVNPKTSLLSSSSHLLLTRYHGLRSRSPSLACTQLFTRVCVSLFVSLRRVDSQALLDRTSHDRLITIQRYSEDMANFRTRVDLSITFILTLILSSF